MHRLDPPTQHRAAMLAGGLAARGLVDGPPLLDAIRRAAWQAAPGCDRRGLAMRLAHCYADARAATLDARAQARRRVAHALAPLLAGRAPGAALLAAADGADAEAALSPDERRAEAAEAIRRYLRRAR